MNPSKVALTLPDYIASKTDSVNSTLELKQTLAVVFTEFFSSNVYTSSEPEERHDATALFNDLNTLIDRIYLEQILHKADQASTIKTDRRSTH